MKEDIEMQSLSLKKLMLIKKLEEVNSRKNTLLLRRKAEAVKTTILKHGLKSD